MDIKQLQLTMDVESLKSRVGDLEKWQDNFHRIINETIVHLEEQIEKHKNGEGFE
tara:strand:- start:120 stop:284 length:165 start_codon:yes stop_codon:yes gene_type:complete